MAHNFNQFQAELQRRGIDKGTAYMLTLCYERIAEQAKLIDDMSKSLLGIANSLQGLVNLHEHTQEGLRRVQRGLREDGIEVKSVANDPETEH